MLILWVRKCEYGVLEITRDTKVLSNHSSSTRDLRLLYHLWFPKTHTHISYSQYFHNVSTKTFWSVLCWLLLWRVFKMHPLHCAKVQRCLNNYFPIRQAHSYFRSLLGESTVDMLQPKLASKWIKRKWLRALSSCGFFPILMHYFKTARLRHWQKCSSIFCL